MGRASCWRARRTPKNRQYEGMSDRADREAARRRGSGGHVHRHLMAEEGGSISGIFHTMSEDDVRT